MFEKSDKPYVRGSHTSKYKYVEDFCNFKILKPCRIVRDDIFLYNILRFFEQRRFFNR